MSARAVGTPKPALLPGMIFLASAAFLGGFALYRLSLPSYLARLFYEISAPLFIAAAGYLSAFFTARARLRGALSEKSFTRRGGRKLPIAMERLRDTLDTLRVRLANIDWQGDWLPLVTALILSAAALLAVFKGWKVAGPAPSQILDQWLGGTLLLFAFPILVVERRFSAMPERDAITPAALAHLARVLLLCLLGYGLSYLLRWLALPGAFTTERVLLLFTALIAAEIFLRCASYFFMPLPLLGDRRGHAGSLIAGLIRFQRPSFSAMSATVSRQFGIDLGRSWAIGFIRRSAFPLLLGLIFSGWLLTGVTALNLSQRAAYEAFGRPQAIFHSGLHVHLPWPFGILRPLDYGAVREIPIVFPLENGKPEEAENMAGGAAPTIEGVPPPSADRLWDSSHPSEASYLVASNRNGKENFEIVNIDLRIIYRVGLSDEAALNALYNIDQPETMIRSAAGRMLARYFARYTIPDVLGQNRDRFIRGFQKELQARLNLLGSGIDILGVVVEAIHPPPEAATAYQDVQAAAIRSVTQVSTAKGDASRLMRQSESEATRMRDQATAIAAETIDQAKMDTTFFAGDVEAHRQDGAAFLFERRLIAVRESLLKPRTPLTVVDHHILQAQMPILDVRPPGSGQPQYVPPISGGGPKQENDDD